MELSNYCYSCMMEVPEGIRVCPNCNAAIPYVSTNARDCPPGTVLNKKYLLGRAIGRGGFGVTYVALDLHTKEKVCIKECNLKDRCYRDPDNPSVMLPMDDEESMRDFEKFKENFLDEKKRLILLRDIPQVVQCYEGFECNNTVYIVQEFLEGRDLKNYVKRERGSKNPLSISESIHYTIEVLDILEQVHRRKMLHRDISPDNIFLLKDGTIKLIDFGSSRRLNSGEMTGFNKPGYAPPEMLLGDAEGFYSDVYSVGAVLYFLLVGEKPEPMEGAGILQPPPKGKSFPELTDIFLRAVQRNVEWRYQTAWEMADDLRRLTGEQIKKRKKGNKGIILVVGALSAAVVLLVFIIVKAGTGGSNKSQKQSEWVFMTNPAVTQLTNTIESTVENNAETAVAETAVVTESPIVTFSPTSVVTEMPIVPDDLSTFVQSKPYTKAIVSTKTVKVYKEPAEDIGYFVKEYKEGEELDLISQNDTWACVRSNEGDEVFVQLSALEFVIDMPTVPIVTETPVPVEVVQEDVQNFETAEDNAFARIINDKAYVYEKPTTYSKVLGTAGFDSKLDLVAYNEKWIIVLHGDETGYMLASDVEIYTDAEALPEQIVTNEPTIEDTVTNSPTPTPIGQIFDSQYVMFVGTQTDIVSNYKDYDTYPLEYVNDNDSVDITDAQNGKIVIKATKIGKCNIVYGNGHEEKSFTVVVVDRPEMTMNMLSEETDELILEDAIRGYTLYIPKGMEAELELEFQESLYGYKMKEIDDSGCAEIQRITGQKDRYKVKAIEEGTKTIEIWSDGLATDTKLFQFDIIARPHIVVSEIEEAYSIPAGDKLVIDIGFSDNNAVSIEDDVEWKGEFLDITVSDDQPAAICIEGKKAGVEDVKIGDKIVRFTVYAPLEMLFDNQYVMLEGTQINCAISNKIAADSLECTENSECIEIIRTNDGNVTIKAVKTGDSVVTYGNGYEEKSFTVTVVAESELVMYMLSEQTDELILERGIRGYTLYIPKGIETELEFEFGETLYGYELRETNDAEYAKIQHIEGYTNRYRVKALEEGTQIIEIWTNGLATDIKLLELEIIARPHIVVSKIVDAYSVLKGDSLMIDVEFSDGDTINVSRDIEWRGELLNITVPVDRPNAICIEGIKAGIEDVKIGDRIIRFTVYAPLEMLFDDRYVMFTGTQINRTLSNESATNSLACTKNRECIELMKTDEGNITIKALKEGESVVTYGNGYEEKTFSVIVIDRPELSMRMLSEETEQLVLQQYGHGYTLFAPAGVSAEIEFDFDDTRYGYKLISNEKNKYAAISKVQGNTYTVNALKKGTQTVEIWTDGLTNEEKLFDLEIEVGDHVVVSEIKDAYAIFEGETQRIGIMFSDKEKINVDRDIKWNGEMLKIYTSDSYPDTLCIEGIKAGVEDVKIANEKLIRFTVYEIPALSASEEFVTEHDGRYDIVMPTNHTVSIPIENMSDDLSLMVGTKTYLGKTIIDIDHEKKLLIIQTGDFIGQGSYTVKAGSKELFTINIEVVDSSAVNEFMDEYVLFEGDELRLPLEYRHAFAAQQEAVSTNSDVATVKLHDGGNEVVVKAHESGNADITIGGKKFRVVVCQKTVGIMTDKNLSYSDGVYYLSIKDTQTTSLLISGWTSQKYSFEVNHVSGKGSSIEIENNKIHVEPSKDITPSKAEEDVYIIRSSGTVNDKELIKLVVRVEYEKMLQTSFDNQYAMIEGSSVKIKLNFRGNAVFDVKTSAATAGIVQLKRETIANEEYLTLHALEPGETTVTVEGKTFKVRVLESRKLVNEYLTEDSEGNYQLSLYKGEKTFVYFDEIPIGYEIRVKYGNHEDKKVSGIEITGDEVGEYVYTFTAVGGYYTQEMYTLKLNVKEPILETKFKEQYSFIEGENAYLPLEFRGEPVALKILDNGNGLEIWQENNRLYVNAANAGVYNVQISDAENTHKFKIAIEKPEIKLSHNGTALAKQSGVYDAVLVEGEEIQFKLEGSKYLDSVVAKSNVSEVKATISKNVLRILTQENSKGHYELVLCYIPKQKEFVSTTNSIEIAKIRVTVQQIWKLSQEAVNVDDGENRMEIMQNVVTALRELEYLKKSNGRRITGSIEFIAENALADGGISEEIWNCMTTAKESNSGFSSEIYYTREDYLRLIELQNLQVALKEQEKLEKEQQNNQSKQRAEKEEYSIVQAAAAGNNLYLLDRDGYVVLYDLGSMTYKDVYNLSQEYIYLAGNGETVIAVNKHYSMEALGNVGSNLMEELDNAVTVNAAQIAFADDAMLIVIGKNGEFSLYNDNKLNPEKYGVREDRIIDEGYACYRSEKNRNFMAVCENWENANSIASDIKLTAAGDHVIAFFSNKNGGNKIFINYTSANVPLKNKIAANSIGTRAFTVLNSKSKPLEGGVKLDPVSLAVSDQTLAVVQSNGTVQMIGENGKYQIGNGKNNFSSQFKKVLTADKTELTGVKKVILQNDYTLYLRNDGTVYISGTVKSGEYKYAAYCMSGVADLIRLDDENILAINNDGWIMKIVDGRPAGNGAFTKVQK